MPQEQARYQRHRPEETPLYQVIITHLESFLTFIEEEYDRKLPRYVENEFRHYVKCGILAYGFSRARCADCGHEIVVAFSCKLRGICPSCNARRMCDSAAHCGVQVIELPPPTSEDLDVVVMNTAFRVTESEHRWLVAQSNARACCKQRDDPR